MSERIQKPKPAPRKKTEAPEEVRPAAKADLAATDELLDEIDSILEEDEVLTNYRQRGGQ